METEVVQWIAIGALLMDKATRLALKIRNNRRNSKKEAATPEPENPGVQLVPGKEQECIERGKLLTRLETDMENLDEDFKKLEKNNREDHNKIFDKLNRVRRK